jgi:hypothetical protein
MKSTNGSSKSRFGDYAPPSNAPPSKEEQITLANAMGPTDEGALERLAQFADQQADFGEWHYGHVTAQRLRLLAESLARQEGLGQEERTRLHRVIADLTQQVDEAAKEGQDIDLTIRFEQDGPGMIQIGELHLMVDLLVEVEGQEGETG